MNQLLPPDQPINAHAPVITRQSITINAPAERVWKIMEHVNDWKSWNKDISAARLSGDFERGHFFIWKAGGFGIRSVLHIAEPFSRIGWSGRALGAYAIHNWFLSETDGITTVRVEESMEGWLVKLMKKTFQSKLDAGALRWLQALKVRAEHGD